MPSMKMRGLLSALPLAIVSLAVFVSLWLANSPSSAKPTYAAALPSLPANWPSTLQIGASSSPGEASSLKSAAPFGFRYQYLAGGVNTGNGWANWNASGNFVTYYIQDSVASSITPVFTYYQMFQSNPGVSQGETSGVYNNMQNVSTMTSYWNDVKLFFQRAGAFSSPVVLHVEPDLWGFLEQKATGDNATTVSAQVASTGLTELAGLPNNLSGYAKAFVKLRDQYAPNVKLGYHISVWGTGNDMSGSLTDAQVDALGTKAGNFYKSLAANFDVAFGEFSDRDAGFYQYVYGDNGNSWWDANDFARNVRFLGKFTEIAQKRIVMWQIPLGNTKMRAMNNTWGHYQDNRVEWLLDDAGRAHLNSYIQAGVVAFLFGGGAGGTTCACDAEGDGVTNPAAINGNNLTSLNSDDDGGFFKQKVSAYYSQGAMSLAGGSSTPPTSTPVAATATPTKTNTPVPAANTATPVSSTATKTAAAGTATRTPTRTRTPVVTATKTKTAVAGTTTKTAVPNSWTVTGSRSPASVAAGGSEQVSVTVTSGSTRNALIDIEIYAANGSQVFQAYMDNQAFTAGVPRTFSQTWQVPAGTAPGTYTVKVGVFSVGWGTLYSWQNSATTFTVTN